MRFEKYLAAGVGGFFIGILAVLFGIVAIFLFAIFGALIGAITGWILEQTPILGPAVKNGFSAVFSVQDPDLVAIGAMLGFIAGFFKHGHGGDKDGWGGGKEECCDWDWSDKSKRKKK
jgi:hypothetical protein